MRTVSSICVSTSTALSVVGLAVASREPHEEDDDEDDDDYDTNNNNNNTNDNAPYMTAVASYPLQNSTFDSSFHPRRLASDGDHGRAHATNKNSTSRKTGRQRRSSSIMPTTAVGGPPMDRPLQQEGDRGGLSNNSGSQATPWLRRLSSSVSNSRDSSRTPSRPGSAAYSIPNGSLAFSQAGSTTPIFPSSTPPSLPPNKLVKRTASRRNIHGSPSPDSGSRLPIPTFRRPATSHQRSATLQGQLSASGWSGRESSNGSSRDTPGSEWRHYFIPRISPEQLPTSRSRSSTGIPNPIKRVYPDRKHVPTLISAKELLKPAAVEVEGDVSDGEGNLQAVEDRLAASTASSPFPTQPTHFEESTAPRRSFSIGDLLSTGPQPLWRRPSSKGKPRTSKSSPRVGSRVSSDAQAAMGNRLSHANGFDSERPAKRRDLQKAQDSQRSIYSWSGSYVTPHAGDRPEIDLNLGSGSPSVQSTSDAAISSRARTPSPSEQHRLPSTTFSSSSAIPQRLSAAQSEITSTVGSDSEYISVGDNSTDYQSDNAYDSIQTRTTRSSIGRRGPHIETIFDESPRAFSSDRSTKLRDLLSDGQSSGGGDHNARYRHSTIEEEGSVASTPVRSLHSRSLASTPSARPSAMHLFSSSPPAMLVPDLEDLDWDTVDNDVTDQGLGINQLPLPSTYGTTVQSSLPFRFGPSLRPGNARSAQSTPLRNRASPMDRTNLFDWSEQQPSPSRPTDSPPRPRTVHGKKDQDSRGSRPTGRRPTGGMHARSHSVPVVPDLDGKRNNVVANKFGTWGVGSKAVTEDWNEDFEFDESASSVYDDAEQEEKRIDSGHEMFVPRSIREQQQNVVANIGLLREWGLLIEELKELRIRAVALDMLNGPYAQAWREVDAMIELADQETEEHTLEPRRSPPSSPGFDDSLFEDTPSKANGGKTRQSPSQPPETSSSLLDVSPIATRNTVSSSTRLTARPRKDSELVAQSVIAALQSRRVEPGTGDAQAVGNRKVPFDTATLRHIVPYVSGLKRKVKDGLRETEGLYPSPRRRTSSASRQHGGVGRDEPTFRNMFNGLNSDSLPIRSRDRREQAATDNDEAALDSE